MVVSVASNVAEPVERLRAVRESTHHAKEFTSAVGARTLTEYSQFIPGGLAALAARTASRFEMANRVDPTANCVVTNVPGHASRCSSPAPGWSRCSAWARSATASA